MTTSVATNLRQLAAAAKRSAAKAAKAQQKKETDQKTRQEEDNRRIDAQIKGDIAAVYESTYAPKIEEVAKRGENKISIEIGSHDDFHFVRDPMTLFSQRERSIYEYLPPYLRQQGCTVRAELKKDRHESRDAIPGERPEMPAYDAYRLFLHIEW